MLDLQPIKDRITAASNGPWKWQRDTSGWWTICDSVGGEVASANLVSEKGPATANGQLLANAPTDLAALVNEVERLRGAIEAHRQNKTAPGPTSVNSDDRELWTVLDA